MIRCRSRRGITLPETVIVAIAFVLLLGGIITLGSTAASEWSQGSSKVMADDNASLTMQLLRQDIRQGIRASLGATSSELYVVRPAVNAQGDYNRYQEGDTVRYYLQSNKVYMRVGTGDPRELGSGISALEFTVDGHTVFIDLTASQKNAIHRKETELRSEVTLRNGIDP